MEGSLDRRPLSEVLKDVWERSDSVVLRVDSPSARRVIYVREGTVVFATSDRPDDRLGERLIRSGGVSRAQIDLACRVQAESKLRLGETLVEMGCLRTDDVEAQVREQVASIVLDAMRSDSGSISAVSEWLAERDAELERFDLSTRELLREHETKHPAPNLAPFSASAIPRGARLRISGTSASVFEAGLRLTPEEGIVLSRVDGLATADEIVHLSPLGAEETARCLEALFHSGLLEIVRERPEAKGPTHPAKPRTPGDGDGDAEKRREYDEAWARAAAPESSALEDVPERATRQARVHYANGSRLFEAGRYQEAIEELRSAVRLDDARVEYHRLLGRALGKNPKWRKLAEEHFMVALTLDRFDAATYVELGELYLELGLRTRARKMFEEAIDIEPDNPRARAGLDGLEP